MSGDACSSYLETGNFKIFLASATMVHLPGRVSREVRGGGRSRRVN